MSASAVAVLLRAPPPLGALDTRHIAQAATSGAAYCTPGTGGGGSGTVRTGIYRYLQRIYLSTYHLSIYLSVYQP